MIDDEFDTAHRDDERAQWKRSVIALVLDCLDQAENMEFAGDLVVQRINEEM